MSQGTYQVNQMRKNYPVKIVPHNIMVVDDPLLQKHWHRSIEIIFVYEGSMEVWIDGITRVLESNDMMIVNRGELHGITRFVTEHQSGCSILIAYSFLKELNPHIDQLWFDERNNQKDNQALADNILRIRDIYQEEGDWYNLRIRSVMYEIIYRLFTDYVRGENKEREKHLKQGETYKEIITYLNEHFKENLRLRDVAAHFGYNEDYFSRTFKKYIGETYKDYLKRIRIYNAHKEITWTDKTIIEIAHENGFADSKAFIRDFKLYFHITPLKYRKSLKVDTLSRK